ncbi:Ankyrin repeat-containing domain [Trinorchestia longiramus]|nr:Ankyrin repeat-containing domain [Trinorchestia longiramus]
MEGSLLRNLSDCRGNNLMHVVACMGHVACLAWLITSLPVITDALLDENKFGQTPVVCAVKYGQVEVVRWLVEHTGVGDRVRSRDGDRSLLHLAAKYNQEMMVRWLVSHMMALEVTLDGRDHHGNTALHLAARTGNSRVCSVLLQHGADLTLKVLCCVLLQHGADLTLKNDLGQKAWEVCVVRGHPACAEYLCVHESGEWYLCVTLVLTPLWYPGAHSSVWYPGAHSSVWYPGAVRGGPRGPHRTAVWQDLQC